ncbi:Anti-sigma-K factor RskA [Microlunatus sagamiharensis]|uniref:Regulator of SigK n=1 Tax=Microlunatus sagamiharensis TaxID=546874 RepID=A0A1H2MBA9_9ACTN|nr:anti-sigma factor [Microlunatus sagamiharensis]SDU90540.1 Anti-sigma-K factor RskA [Microlunatus sagamiharensis]
MTEHDAEHDAAGTYVVGALQTRDLETFEQHLRRCADCRLEVAQLQETAAELGWLAAAPPPPASLRAAVLSAVPGVAQLPPIPKTDVPAGLGDLAAARTARSRSRDRLARRTRALSLLVAAVSVVALALGGVVVSLSGRQDAPAASSGTDVGLLAAPDARIVPAAMPDGTTASFVVSQGQNRALFVAHGLPDVGSGRTYQLWTVRGGTAVPDSTLGGGADVSQWFHGSVTEAEQLAVTVEPAGGSARPTTPVLASVSL